jgi:hypothetical protein
MTLVLLALTLAAVAFAPVQARDGRAVLLVVGLVALIACRWSNRWRQAVMAAVLVSFLTHVNDGGWALVLGVFLAGEAIEVLKAQPEWVHRMALGMVALVAVLLSLYALGQVQGTLTWHRETVLGAYATLDNPATLGAFLAIAAPAVALTWYPALGVVVPALFVSFSTTAVVAATAALFTASFLMARWRIPVLVAGAFSCLAFILFWDTDPASAIQRGGVWLWTLDRSREAWLLGFGPGSFAALELRESAHMPAWLQAHNEFVQWQYEIGLAGTLAVGGYLVHLARGLWVAPRTPLVLAVAAMLVALGVTANGHFVFHLAPTAVLGIVTLGIAEAIPERGV